MKVKAVSKGRGEAGSMLVVHTDTETVCIPDVVELNPGDELSVNYSSRHPQYIIEIYVNGIMLWKTDEDAIRLIAQKDGERFLEVQRRRYLKNKGAWFERLRKLPKPYRDRIEYLGKLDANFYETQFELELNASEDAVRVAKALGNSKDILAITKEVRLDVVREKVPGIIADSENSINIALILAAVFVDDQEKVINVPNTMSVWKMLRRHKGEMFEEVEGGSQ